MEPVSRRHSKGSIIWRFFIAYIVVIVMVLLIISPICVTLPQVTYRNLLDSYRTQLEHQSEQFNMQLESALTVNDVLDHIQSYQMLKVSNVAGSEAPARYSYYLNKLRDLFRSQVTMLNLYEDGFLLFTRSGMCVTTKVSYVDFESCLDSYFKYSPEDRATLTKEIDEGYNAVSLLPVSPASVSSGRRENCMTLLLRNPTGSVVTGLLINEEKLQNYFLDSGVPGDSVLTITGYDGTLLMKSGETPSGTVHTLKADVPMTGGAVEISIPSGYIDRIVGRERWRTVFYVVVAVAAGLALSAYLSARHIRPIRKIAGYFQQNGKNRDEYQQIMAGISASSREMDAMRKTLDENQARMRLSLFSRMLYGVILSEDDQSEALRLIPELAEPYQIALLRIDLSVYSTEKQEGDYASVMAAQYLQEVAGDRIPWVQPDREHFALLLPKDRFSAEDIRTHAEKFSYYMDRYNVCMMYGISDVFTEIDKVSAAYSQARFRMRILNGGDPAVIREHSASLSVHGLQKIYEAICAGNREALSGAMEEIARSVSADEAEENYSAIRYGIRCALQDLNPAPDLPEPPRYAAEISAEENFVRLNGWTDDLIRQISTDRSRNDLEFVQKVTEYIAEHYRDPELGVDSIAREFYISRSQLYSLFQQNSVHSVGELIRKERMEQARNMLASTRDSVSDIAQQCGFASVNTFCRAFKKYYGISPNAMRNGTEPGGEA